MPPIGAATSAWELTGVHEFRRGWFGRPVLYVAERRRAWRPVVTGYTPANWQDQARWRRARMSDLERLP